MSESPSGEGPLWEPSPAFLAETRMTAYLDYLERDLGYRFEDYRHLWQWSIDEPAPFWLSIRDFFDLDITDPDQVLDNSDGMPYAAWFTGASTNYAANALRTRGNGTAMVSLTESGERTELSWDQLRTRAGALAHWLRQQGLKPGDRVAAYVPNVADAAIGLLACAAIGAIWASCSQEYSSDGALDRLSQLEPKILITADGYHYGGKAHDRRDDATALASALPTVRTTVWINNLGLIQDTHDGTRFDQITAEGREPVFTDVPFSHPLWVLFSSGTTGKPKGIVHSHGGIVLEHTKFLGLHADLQPRSRFLWLATPSWMVWNVQISGLLCGATITTYDGSPAWPDPSRIWQLAEQLELDYLGVSAASLIAAQKHGADPCVVAPKMQLRGIGSTGSPLPPNTARWVQAALPHVWLASASGGTDICSAFAGGIPTEPVYADQIQGPLLGASLASWDDDAQSVVDEAGEMVVTRPMPSMPVSFWNDPDKTRYLDSYFEHYPDIWRQGDSITITHRGGVIVHGRSDATMNRQGVRIGNGEIYEVVDQLPQVRDSVIIGLQLDDGDYWMPLFVVPTHQGHDPEQFANHLKQKIRSGVSPRHVPDDVIIVENLPHTRTGKKLEVPIRRILQGSDPAKVASPQSVDDFEALNQFTTLRRAFPERERIDLSAETSPKP